MPFLVSRHLPLVLLALITLGAAGLRLVQLGESLWVDELHTAWTVAEEPGQIAWRARQGNQSPLYFYVVWASTAVLGMSELALRLPSLLAGVALVPLAYWVVGRWTAGWLPALLAAVLVAVDRTAIFYAQEARPYAWVQLVGLLHVLVFWRLLITPGEPDLGRVASSAPARWQSFRARRGSIEPQCWLRGFFVLGAAVLFYLHYTAFLLLAAELVGYILLRTRWLARRVVLAYRPGQLLLDLLLIAVLLLPAVPHLAQVAERRENWKQFVSPWPSAAMQDLVSIYIVLPLLLVAVANCLRWLVTRGAVRPRRGLSEQAVSACLALRSTAPQALTLVLCWLAVPAAIAWVATATGVAHLFMLRYLMVSAVAPMLVAAICCSWASTQVLRAMVGLVVLTLAISASGIVQQYRHDGRVVGDRNENWPAAVRLINETSGARQLPVFVCPGLIEDEALRHHADEPLRQYCLYPVQGIYRIERDADELIPLPTRGSPRMQPAHWRLIEERGGAWFVIRGRSGTVDAVVTEVLSGSQHRSGPLRLVSRQAFGGVHVVRFERKTG